MNLTNFKQRFKRVWINVFQYEKYASKCRDLWFSRLKFSLTGRYQGEKIRILNAIRIYATRGRDDIDHAVVIHINRRKYDLVLWRFQLSNFSCKIGESITYENEIKIVHTSQYRLRIYYDLVEDPQQYVEVEFAQWRHAIDSVSMTSFGMFVDQFNGSIYDCYQYLVKHRLIEDEVRYNEPVDYSYTTISKKPGPLSNGRGRSNS